MVGLDLQTEPDSAQDLATSSQSRVPNPNPWYSVIMTTSSPKIGNVPFPQFGSDVQFKHLNTYPHDFILLDTYPTVLYMLLSCLDRRIEDKLEAKGLDAESVFLRFDAPPANKRVALSYQAWIITSKGTNMWTNSLLYQDRPSECLKND